MRPIQPPDVLLGVWSSCPLWDWGLLEDRDGTGSGPTARTPRNRPGSWRAAGCGAALTSSLSKVGWTKFKPHKLLAMFS